MNDNHSIAVNVQNVVFAYKKKSPILNKINLSVPKGHIYALLGSSGCGKTTLLRLLLSQLKPKSGSIKVFGTEPGSRFSDIPGSGVGYMPQQLALYPEFTIEETLAYFGKLYDIPRETISNRTEFLIKLLNLADMSARIKSLSGGQKRMVSFACTLLHYPPLLILDEPTVGVDPLYRYQIWEYLESICLNDGKTVILTTHYIEEAKTASTVGFMSNGVLLTQSNPKDLLRNYNVPTLEEVFLKILQTEYHEIRKQLLAESIDTNNAQQNEPKIVQQLKIKNLQTNHKKLGALFLKNYLSIKRNPMLMFFFLILPVIQITLFCASFGKIPRNLPIATIAQKNRTDLSSKFLDSLEHEIVKQTDYESLELAIDAVQRGKAWIAIDMSHNFSDALEKFAKNPNDLSAQQYADAKIKIYADFSNSVIALYLYRSLIMSYADVFIPSIGENFATIRSPFQIHKPIYGVNERSLDEFLAPGAIIAIIFSTPLIMASFLLVIERQDGLLERSYMAGVRAYEVLCMHLITMMIALVLQVSLLMFVCFVIFKVALRGSVTQVFALIYMSGLQGVTFGLLISALSANQVQSFMASFGLILPVWMMCGVFWPLEGMPALLREIVLYAPLSLPIQSMRCVVSRGWTIFYPTVFTGYAVSFAYNFALILITVFVFHFNFP